VKEIWLTAQDTGCYGKGTIDNLAFLVRSIAALDGDFMIRVGMANPNHIRRMLGQLIEAFKHPKVFKFLHIPVQSGNNEILKKMNRRYYVGDFKSIVEAFREEIPEMTIATDVICGFPGETKEQFMDTAKLISEIKPDVVNISRFWPRPGTEAAEMKGQIHGQETKNRSTYIKSTFEWTAFQSNKEWRKWEGEIMISDRGKDDTWLGRNYCYKLVVVEGNLKIGDKVKVRITGAEKHYLFGELIQ
jgi:MiaB/RimO family radical SAM methylthiotransferase